jgi:acyl-CoA synthetase (AMP-forming)/AMP-acid ligase II
LSSLNLADLFVGLSDRWAQQTAVVSPHLNLTYSELVGRAARTARELRSRDDMTGARIGLCFRDSAETLTGMIAVWMLGATAVPLDFRTPPAERARLAQELALKAVLEDRQGLASAYDSILVGPAWQEALSRHEPSPLWTDGDSAAPAVISLTSGTTGRPVGVVIEHERLLLRSIVDPFQQFGAALLNPLPVSFSASRTYTLAALLQGATVHCHPALFSMEELISAIQSSGVGSVCLVPTMIRGLLDVAGDRTSPLFDGLKALYAVGAPLHPEEKLRAKKSLSSNLVDGYGASICGPISALFGPDIDANPDSVGRILPHVVVQIVDDNDEPLPAGEQGIVRVRAPGMARGFYQDSGSRSGDSLKNGWAYPGDLGAVDNNGFLRLSGRTSDLIIRGGANVYPSEVEASLAEHEGVKEVAVVGFAKTREGEEIAAFIVGAPNLTEAALMAHCRARLTPDKRPRKFVFVEALPRNLNGKVSRAELRKQLEEPV